MLTKAGIKVEKVIENEYMKVKITQKKNAGFNNHNLQYGRFWEGQLASIKQIGRELLGKEKTNEIIKRCEQKIKNIEVE